MCCLDVDGTIIAKEGDFYLGVQWMCNQLNKMNWKIVLCSARPIQSLVLLADKLVGIEWVCGLGGAVIAHKVLHNKKMVSDWKIYYHTDYIDTRLLIPIFDWVTNNNVGDIWLYDLTKWYATSKTNYVEREAFIINLEPTIISFRDIPQNKLLKLVFPYIPIDVMGSLQDCAKKHGFLSNYITDTQVELNSFLTSDKGINQLRKLVFCGQKAKVLSVGDGANDFGMLLHSDIALTFEDGHFSLQKIAQFILDKNREKAYNMLIDLISSGIIN